MKKHQIFSIFVVSLWILLLCFAGYFYFTHNVTVESVIFGAKNYAEQNPVEGIILFIIFYVMRPLFFVIASPFDIFSGMVFGPVYGFFISVTGTFFSTMFSYAVGRVTGGQLIPIGKSHKALKMKKRLHNDTFFTTMMMRFLLLPYDLSNYFCGVFKTPFWKYVAGTSLGVMPATFIVVSAGSAFYGENITSYQTLIENIKYENLWFASGFFITILVVARILKKKYKNINF